MNTLYIEAFRHFSFPHDLAQRRLFEKVKESHEPKEKTQEIISRAKEDARRIYRV